jgi:hypothetical protein
VEICKPLARNGRMKKSISVVRSLNPTPYATPAPPPVVAPAPADDASTPAATKPARRVNTASSLFLVQIRTGSTPHDTRTRTHDTRTTLAHTHTHTPHSH